MICIFSTASDQTTTDVIRWLRHLGAREVIRVNAGSPDVGIDVNGEDLRFDVGGRSVHLRSVRAVWYRKGRHWLCSPPEPDGVTGSLTGHLRSKLREESFTLSEFLHRRIANTVPTLGAPDAWRINKLSVLETAQRVGLMVPPFVVTTRKATVAARVESSSVITKAMSDGLYVFDRDAGRGYFSYTELVSAGDLHRLPDVIAPSFIQEYVPKKYDVRVFYLAGECFGMAVLSQADSLTRVDFRKYNDKVPNRCVPYVLPRPTLILLERLFDELKLNTGSADFVVAEDGTHYFLEVNPVGQFGMMSEICNYQLERRVARHLLRHANQV